MPPIPELPELPSTAGVTTPSTPPAATEPAASTVPGVSETAAPQSTQSQSATTTPAAMQPTNSPKVIPTIPNGDELGPNLGTAAAATPSTVSQPPATTSPPLATNPPAPVSPAATTAVQPSPPALGSSLTPAASSPAAPPAATNASPSPAASASAAVPEEPDRYGNVGTAHPTCISALRRIRGKSATSRAAGASIAASWPAIQAALDRGDLKQAHQLLSKWHGDETLSAADSEKVETLLGQLAGTVIYSTDYQLEPARVVKSGETSTRSPRNTTYPGNYWPRSTV